MGRELAVLFYLIDTALFITELKLLLSILFLGFASFLFVSPLIFCLKYAGKPENVTSVRKSVEICSKIS